MPATDTVETDDAEQRRPISRSAKIQILVAAVNLVFWGAILIWTVTRGDADTRPDRLEERAFPTSAEPICAAALADIDALGLDPIADSPDERAGTVDQTNVRLREMVASLRALERPSGEEGEWVAAWLDDWDTHIGDRQAWADGLRAGRDEPFVESDRAGEQISKVVDNFAEVNDMASCATTHDV